MAAKETTVAVKIELGHRAKIRDKPNEQGHTHDWMVYVKGAEGAQLRHFVEKVVFHLHNSYDQPKRVIKQPPYRVENSGFAGFNMPIELYFRNQEDPKKVLFEYDLFLLMKSMPPVNHNRLEKLTFTNPTEDFRKKLLDAGAVLIESPERHSSKERSRDGVGMSPKKDRPKSRDHSKKRESSSSRHGDKKRSTARIAAKDIKRHEDEFKHPKVPESSKSGRDSPGDAAQQERGRSDKKRSASDHVSGKKKKKKHASPSPHEPRPKSLNLAKKDKARKIKDKPDLMAGLFAPENSINMTHIKQSKDKIKAESTDVKVKKDKASANATPVRRVDSPRTEERVSGPVSKSSPTGNLTLKIKKDRISASKDRDSVRKERSSEKRDKIRTPKEEITKAHKKQRMKENFDAAKVKKEESVKRVAVVSSSESDMDISPESSPERQKPVVKAEKKVKSSKHAGDSPARSSKSDRKSAGQVVASKPEKLKFDKSNFRKESPTLSRVKDKKGRSESPKPRPSHAVSSKSSKDGDRAQRKAKKEKRSSREKSEKAKSKSKSEREVVKSEGQTAVGAALKTENRDLSSKSSKSVSSEYGKEKRSRKISPAIEKSTKKSLHKPEVKAKTVKAPKSRSFIDTDSSSDCDDPLDRFGATVPRIDTDPVGERGRAGSVSSRSSVSSSEPSENTPSHARSSSSSAASSDEDDLQKISESNVAPGRALSPIDRYPDDPGTVSGYPDANLHSRDDSSDSERGSAAEPAHAGPGVGDAKKSPRYSPPVHDDPGADDLYMSSDEEFGSPLEKPFEDAHDAAFEDETQARPDILVDTGTAQKYPHMTQELYRELQDLQRRLSYVTDVDRLCKIARIVDKSQKLLRNNDYLDFDLCTLDERTIHKIKKEL